MDVLAQGTLATLCRIPATRIIHLPGEPAGGEDSAIEEAGADCSEGWVLASLCCLGPGWREVFPLSTAPASGGACGGWWRGPPALVESLS